MTKTTMAVPRGSGPRMLRLLAGRIGKGSSPSLRRGLTLEFSWQARDWNCECVRSDGTSGRLQRFVRRRPCCAAQPARRSVCGRATPEADDIAIGVLDVEVLRAPRSRRKRLDDRCAVRCALRIERLDAVHTGRRVEVLVRTLVSALVGILGRFLQVELQPVQLTNRVKPAPRLAECETELLVVGDRAGKVVDQELWSEGCHPRLQLGSSHECPRSVMRCRLTSALRRERPRTSPAARCWARPA